MAVKCQTACKSKSGSAQAITDEYGDFLIDLPSHLHGIPNLQNICAIKVLRIPKNSMCRPAFAKKQKELRFSSVGNGIRTYTAGRIRFQHITSKPLKACIRRASSDKQIAWVIHWDMAHGMAHLDGASVTVLSLKAAISLQYTLVKYTYIVMYITIFCLISSFSVVRIKYTYMY